MVGTDVDASGSEGVSRQTHLPRPVVLVFAHVDPRALGIALGLVCGTWLCLASLILVIKGGEHVGRYLSLLSQYFIGFTVTPIGSLIGFAYGAAFGFISGYSLARLRNFLVRTYLRYLRRRGEQEILSDMLDRIM